MMHISEMQNAKLKVPICKMHLLFTSVIDILLEVYKMLENPRVSLYLLQTYYGVVEGKYISGNTSSLSDYRYFQYFIFRYFYCWLLLSTLILHHQSIQLKMGLFSMNFAMKWGLLATFL